MLFSGIVCHLGIEVQHAVQCGSVLRYCFASEVHAFQVQVFSTFNQFRLFCKHPSSGGFSEKTLEVHKNQTLGEATERAYKVDSTLG